MAVGFIAFHYPHPAHRDGFVARVEGVAGVLRGTPGCQGVEYWLTADGEAVVSQARFGTQDELTAAFGALLSADVDVEFDEREVRPREIYQLVSP